MEQQIETLRAIMEEKIKELEKRISELEKKRPQNTYYYPVVPMPMYPQPSPTYRCPICGSAGGCWHVTC